MNRHAYFRQQEKNELMHHGIKGQKWGIRRYQNPDGTYTEEGKIRKNAERPKKLNWKESGILDVTHATFTDKTGKEYYARLEDYGQSYKKEDAKRIQKVIEDMIDDKFVDNIKNEVSDYIAGSYKSENFGLNKMSNDEFKQYIKNNVNIEGIAFGPWIDRYGGKDIESYDACPFGVDYIFDDIPFMNDIDGILDLTNKKIRDIGYAYPD